MPCCVSIEHDINGLVGCLVASNRFMLVYVTLLIIINLASCTETGKIHLLALMFGFEQGTTV